MTTRRTTTVLLLFVLTTLALPATSEAFIGGEDVLDTAAGLWDRVAAWIAGATDWLTKTFTAAEGAAMTGNG